LAKPFASGLDRRAALAYLFLVRTKCPTCRRELEGTAGELPFRPFCSERCRSADFSKWLSDSYRISAPMEEEDLDEGPRADGESLSKDPVN
jgi:endogenous inhibitor of DNA gyrase (YacG/DUF329 family)